MGTIKLPKKSIKFLKKLPCDLEQGALAEGKWNQESSKVVKKYVGINMQFRSSNGTGMAAMLQLMKHCLKEIMS